MFKCSGIGVQVRPENAVIQGYNGLAVVDDKAQVVVHAEAHGSGYEAHLIAPVLEATRDAFEQIQHGADIFDKRSHR